MNDIFSFFEKPKAEELARFVTAQALARGAGLSLERTTHGVTVALAEAVDLAWSSGEVIAGQLLSQKIFGPVESYKCECGKYARMKHRGVVCEVCGVEVIGADARAKRFGHIALRAPVIPEGFAAPWTVVPVIPPDLRGDALDDAYARVFDRDPKTAVDAVVSLTLDRLVAAIAPPRSLRTDYSGSATAIVTGRRRAPLDLLVRMMAPLLMGICESLGYTTTIKSAKQLLQKQDELAKEFVRMALHDRVVLFGGRTATIVAGSIEAADDPVIELDHDTANAIGAKTGDQVSLFFPITDDGQAAAKRLRAGSTPLPSSASWIQDVAFAMDPRSTLLRHAKAQSTDPCTWPIAALLVGGYEPSDAPAPRIELGPPPPQKEEEPKGHPHLDRSVDELEMSVRTANALQNANIQTIRDLVQRTEADLLKSKDFGRKSLKEVKEILGEMGLMLGMRL